MEHWLSLLAPYCELYQSPAAGLQTSEVCFCGVLITHSLFKSLSQVGGDVEDL